MGENGLERRAGVQRSFKTGKDFELNFKAMVSNGGFLLRLKLLALNVKDCS